MALWGQRSTAGPAHTRRPAEARWFHWLGLRWTCLLSMQAPESCTDSRWDVRARSTRGGWLGLYRPCAAGRVGQHALPMTRREMRLPVPAPRAQENYFPPIKLYWPDIIYRRADIII